MTIGASGSSSYSLTKATTDLVGNETESFTYTATDRWVTRPPIP